MSWGTIVGLLLGSLLLAGCTHTGNFVSFPGVVPDTKPTPQGAFPDKELTFTARLTRPRGDGPFPAVVVLHGCFGIFHRDEAWALQLAEWGYVSLLADSFGPRGERSVCDEESRIPASVRAYDAHAAKDFLGSLPFVRRDRIAVIGWGHGGLATLYAASTRTTVRPGAPQFRAAVAFYPFCYGLTARDLQVPLMILIGERDPFTPAVLCQSLTNVDSEVHVYPGAVHGFDLPGSTAWGFSYDSAAAGDSERRIKDFFTRRLR